MALGVDTADALSSVNWGAFRNWCGLYPVFADRSPALKTTWKVVIMKSRRVPPIV
jgi:hypothetical protein